MSGSGASFTILVSPQTATGTYRFVVGPNILDAAGNPMDQVTFTDVFGLLADTTAPAIISYTPSGAVGTGVGTVRVVFSEAITPASFTAADVIIQTPQGNLATTGISVAPVVSGRPDLITTFDVTFPNQTVSGNYTLVIGPNINDLTGNPMAATYAATFAIDRQGPRVVAMTPSGGVEPPVATVEISSTPSSMQRPSALRRRLAAPDAFSIPATDVTRISSTAPGRLRDQTRAGTYTVSVGPTSPTCSATSWTRMPTALTVNRPTCFTGPFTIGFQADLSCRRSRLLDSSSGIPQQFR